MVVDAHVHLWKLQCGRNGEGVVKSVGNGKSSFGSEVRQMLPPYFLTGENTVDQLISNMDYAQVNCAVVTQEYIDGNQNTYLLEAKKKYPDRIKICSLYEENQNFLTDGFDGIKICAGRLKEPLENTLPVFEKAEELGKFISVDLAEGDKQTFAMEWLVEKCPRVKIAIGHFGMAGRAGWERQIELACHPNVFIESGGITWLFHKEFYPFPSAVDAVLRAADICGMEKLMWGSDYPRTMTAITYRMAKDFVMMTDRLSEQQKRLFLGENAERFYGFVRQEELPYIKNMVED